MLPVADLTTPVLSTGTSGVTGPPPVPADATSCSYWDFFFNPSAWQACVNAASVAQIQSVVDNANYYYGPGSSAAQAATSAAMDQELAVPSDTAEIADYYGAGSLLATPGGVSSSGMLGIPWWGWAIAGLGLYLVLK